MNPKILLTGSTGQVGWELHRFLPRIGRVFAPDRRELDLSNPDQICSTILELRPEIIVNAAAYTAVDLAEKDETTAFAINEKAPGIIAEVAKKIGAAVVHYSTDYVFDGAKRTPYDETDPVNPINIYGKSKLAGEVAIQASGVPHLIFRCAWIYGTRGKNFLLTILRLAAEQAEIKVVYDQTGAPTWSREIAATTTNILAHISSTELGCASFDEYSGVFHMSAAGEISWFEFARAVLAESDAFSADAGWYAVATGAKPLRTARVTPISTSEFPTAARRPAFSVLSNKRLHDVFGIRLADWHTQFRQALRDETSSLFRIPREKGPKLGQ